MTASCLVLAACTDGTGTEQLAPSRRATSLREGVPKAGVRRVEVARLGRSTLHLEITDGLESTTPRDRSVLAHRKHSLPTGERVETTLFRDGRLRINFQTARHAAAFFATIQQRERAKALGGSSLVGARVRSLSQESASVHRGRALTEHPCDSTLDAGIPNLEYWLTLSTYIFENAADATVDLSYELDEWFIATDGVVEWGLLFAFCLLVYPPAP